MKTTRLSSLTLLAGVWTMAALSTQAQPRVFIPSNASSEITDIGLVRVAVGPNGASAIVFEAQTTGAVNGEWQIGVQPFMSSGAPNGPLHLFWGKSCGFSWTTSYMDHPAVAYRSDGVLLVLMQLTGDYGFDEFYTRTAETRMAAIDPSGQVIDIAPNSGNCDAKQLTFVGGGRQDRPRMDLTPNAEVFVTVDGFFQESDFRNVSIRVLDNQLNNIQGLDEIIPHDDPRSQQSFHWNPDIATNGSVVLSLWQECPMIDNQGNAAECDISAQFAKIAGGELQALGGNIKVNAGDPAGTINVLPSVAMNAAGNSVVVWVDGRAGAQGEVFGQRFDASGQPVGANFQISTGQGEIVVDANTGAHAEVAMLDDGSFMVVWTDRTESSASARGRRYHADGSPAGPPFPLATGGAGRTAAPDITTDGQSYTYLWIGVQDGVAAIFSNTLGNTVSSEEAGESAGLTFDLETYPNPFNTTATIRYSLDGSDRVLLSVHDLLGREIARLVDAVQSQGKHEVSFDGAALPAGTYIVRLRHGSSERTQLLVHTR